MSNGKKLLWGMLFATLFMVLLGAVRERRTSVPSGIAVSVVDKTGGAFITEKEVKKMIEEQLGTGWENESLNFINAAEIENALEKTPFIKRADVFIDSRKVLHVDIRQRTPLVRVFDNTGGSWYLDVDGKRIPVSRHYSPRVPVATGNIPPYAEGLMYDQKSTLTQLKKIIEYINTDELLQPLTEQIVCTKNKEFVIVPSIGNHRIILGDASDLDDKARRLKIFYKEALSRQGWNRYKTINLNFKGQVICKKD